LLIIFIVILSLKPASFGKRDDLHAAHHQVVQQADINQLQRLLKTRSDLSSALLGSARPDGWQCATMTAAAVMLQTGLNHLAGMDLRMVDGAGEERFVGNQTMLVIEEEYSEYFTLQ
jgi:hypothetical protein